MGNFRIVSTVEDVLVDVIPGQVSIGKAVVVDNNSKIDTIDITSLKLNGTAVTASATEINNLNGLTRGSIIVGGESDVTGKLDAKGDGKILVGDGTDLKSVSISGDATLANTGELILAVPKVEVISKICAIADFIDNGDTTGYIDFTSQLPAGAVVLGWKAIVSAGFTGDTSAVVQIGVEGALNKFSASVAQSVFTPGTVGSGAPMDTCFNATASTVRVTVTSNSDFTSVVTDGTGAMTVYIYYVKTI